MKPPPTDPEFAHFTEAMRTIVGVSKTELMRRMDADKRGKHPRSSSSPAPAAPSKNRSSRRGDL